MQTSWQQPLNLFNFPLACYRLSASACPSIEYDLLLQAHHQYVPYESLLFINAFLQSSWSVPKSYKFCLPLDRHAEALQQEQADKCEEIQKGKTAETEPLQNICIEPGYLFTWFIG